VQGEGGEDGQKPKKSSLLPETTLLTVFKGLEGKKGRKGKVVQETDPAERGRGVSESSPGGDKKDLRDVPKKRSSRGGPRYCQGNRPEKKRERI